MKKLPKREKKNFLFFYNLFHIYLSPYGKKEKHLLFPHFLSPEIGKPQRKTFHKKFFFLFFFLLFCIVPLLVIKKITTFLFFPNSGLKCPKLTLRVRKFHFFINSFFFCSYLFSPRDYANTYTYPHTLRFSDP